MNWFDGMPEVAGVLIGTAVSMAAALWAARSLRMDAVFRWLLPPPEQGPLADVDRFAALADLARREGVLQLEPVTSSRDAVLSTGIRLLAEGAGRAELRRQLEAALDADMKRETREGSGRWKRVAHVVVVAVATFALVCVWQVGIGSIRAVPAAAALLICYGSLLALATVGPLCDRAFAGTAGNASRALSGMMALEAVMVIADRGDGAAVRARLVQLLPPSARGAALAAAA